jgi:D-alanine-D-alanine ligase
VIHTAEPSAVLRRTVNTREWEGYRDNARDIASAIDALGHQAVRLADGRTIVDALSDEAPDLAWICSGGIQGRDPATHLPALLEMLGLEYVGSRPLAAGLADTKARAKAVVRAAGTRTPEFAVVREGAPPPPALEFGYPVVVKPVCGMCACGVIHTATRAELDAAVASLQRRYHDDVLIEQYVDGLDVTVSLLHDGSVSCLPPLRRFFAPREDPAYAHFPLPHPSSQLREGPPVVADLSETERRALCAAAETAFAALGLRHFARLDFRIAGAEVWFLEANHKPDLTRASLFATSARLAGLDYPTLIGRILTAASAAS